MTDKATEDDLLEYIHRWRRVDGVLQIWRSTEIYGSYESFTVESLQERVAESGVEDYRLSVESYNDYGDERARLVIEGWRTPDAREIKEALNEIDKTRAMRAQMEARQIAELKRTRPELFR